LAIDLLPRFWLAETDGAGLGSYNQFTGRLYIEFLNCLEFQANRSNVPLWMDSKDLFDIIAVGL